MVWQHPRRAKKRGKRSRTKLKWDWLKIYAVARFDLGLSDEDFYRLTPRQFFAVLERESEQRKHVELLHAMTTAACINHSFNPPKTAVLPERFMPSIPQKVERHRGVRKKIAQDIERLFDGLAAQSKAEAKHGR